MREPRLRFQAAAPRSSDPRLQQQVSPELPACPANLGLVSRHDHASQFLKRNPSLYIYMYFASSVSLENADEYRHDVSPLLQSFGGSAPDPPALRPSQPPALCSGPEGRTRERKYKSTHPLPWNRCMQMATLLIHSLQVTTDEGCSQGPGMLHEGTGAIGASRTGCLYVSVDHVPDTSLSLYVKYAVCSVMRSVR